MKFRNLAVLIFIIAYLLIIELFFEYRAINRGFNAYLLELNKSITVNTKKANQEVFPYRSPPISETKKPNKIRIWMSSASYAEDRKRDISELFPNILCENLSNHGKGCEMINAARAGLTIHDNIDQIKQDAANWKPDYAILYSMNLDINELSHQFIGLKNTESNNDILNDKKLNEEANLTIDETIEETVEKMTVYSHLRRYIGGQVLLSSILHDEISHEAGIAFKQTIEDFIKTCHEIGIKPILVTFATQYNTTNYQTMNYDEKLSLMRYNEYLSNKGWVYTVEYFNKIIRDSAKEYNVPFIDLSHEIGGRKSYFTDFVHFSKEGHIAVADTLSRNLTNILKLATN